MTNHNDPKTFQKMYLQRSRDALVWKLDGLDERAARLPRTATGTNLLGIVKHCANIEVGYLGTIFGRVWPTPEELVPLEAYDTDPNADLYATEHETLAGILDLYRRVWAFADATIDELPLYTVGRVPWWPAERAEATLERIIMHTLTDISRHAGQADILREQIDGAVGLTPTVSNVPGDVDWPSYVAKLTSLAESYAPGA